MAFFELESFQNVNEVSLFNILRHKHKVLLEVGHSRNENSVTFIRIVGHEALSAVNNFIFLEVFSKKELL